MKFGGIKGFVFFLLVSWFNQMAFSQTTDQDIRNLGNGFLDHGAATPIAISRGTVATVDGKEHNTILTWLSDHRGTYSLLMINTDQGKSEQFFLPFTGHSYTSILSSRNRYYTHFEGRFVEFDPAKRDFTFIGKTPRGSAMSMTEDGDGVIWAALMPDCRLISYNPETGELTDYGVIHSEKARQKPRSIAADNDGWIYLTAGPPAKEKIVAFNPKTKHTRMLLNNVKFPGNLTLFNGQNGAVLGGSKKTVQMELQKGKRKNKTSVKINEIKPFATGSQFLFHGTFPDGKRIINKTSSENAAGFISSREVIIQDPNTGQSQKVSFDYETEGASLMGIATGPGERIVGGSNFPMYFFQYDPNEGTWNRHNAYRQFNTLAMQENQLFIGAYTRGHLLKWDPMHEWTPTRKIKEGANPEFLAEAHPDVFRPHDLLGYPDGSTIIMAGRPPAGQTGGGLLFWDRKTRTADILKHNDIVPNQSTHSLVALPNGKLLGGTNIKPGDSGGVPVAEEAVVYIMDLESKIIEWSEAVIPGAKNYQDLCVAPDGVIMGVAGRSQFFVFDPQTREVLQQADLRTTFGSITPFTQGQRLFIKGPEDEIYLLLEKGILQINPDDFEMTLLAKSPEKINGGGAYLNGHIYYISSGRSRIHSYTLPTVSKE